MNSPESGAYSADDCDSNSAAITASSAPCGCPTGPGRVITEPTRHAAWHALVVEQGGPAGVVDVESCRAARGLGADVVTATRARTSSTWTDREDSTWIDKL